MHQGQVYAVAGTRNGGDRNEGTEFPFVVAVLDTNKITRYNPRKSITNQTKDPEGTEIFLLASRYEKQGWAVIQNA